MDYRVIITPRARRSLSRYIHYTKYSLKNPQAALYIAEDARNTKSILSEVADILAYCDHPVLAEYGYRKIPFRNHDFFYDIMPLVRRIGRAVDGG